MVWKENTALEQELGSSGLNCSLPTPQPCLSVLHGVSEGSSWEFSTSLPTPSPAATRQNLGGPKADNRWKAHTTQRKESCSDQDRKEVSCCERSDSNLFRASQTTEVWSSGAHWRSSPLAGDAQHPFLNSEYELPDPPGQAALGQALTSVEGRWKLLPCSELVLSILIWSTSFSPFQSTAITSFPVGTHPVRLPNATTICSISLKPTQLSKQENHWV